MSYGRQTWTDGASGGTPLSAARLAHMEAGIADAANAVATITSFGAVADGSDCTAAIQAAADSLSATGGVVWIPEGKFTVVGSVNIASVGVSVRGVGTLVMGQSGVLTLGTASARTEMNASISGITFTRSSWTTGARFIQIQRVRGLRIHDCVFTGADQAIYVMPTVGAAVHDVSMHNIHGNRFGDVNYSWYVDQDSGAPWGVTADCHFVNNITNVSYIAGVYVKQIDGVEVSDSRFFTLSYNSADSRRSQKTNNIYVGQSDWVSITGNTLFEAGADAILLDEPVHYVVADNNIAWPGQLTNGAGLKVTNSATRPFGSVTGNVISRFTSNGVTIMGLYKAFSSAGNTFEYDASTFTWLGGTALTSTSHFRFYFDDATATSPLPDIGEPARANDLSQFYDKLPNNSVMTGTKAWGKWSYVSVSRAGVTAGSAVTWCKLSDVLIARNDYSGLVLVTAKNADTNTTQEASYLLHVSRSNDGTGAVATISGVGRTAGTLATDPSFTFGFNPATHFLTCTPVGSTSGTFVFWFTTIGNLIPSS